MLFYDHAIKEKKRIKKELQSINAKLRYLPKENFYCSRNGNYYKWYKTTGKTKTYIPRSEQKVAEKYAIKQYLTELKKELLREEIAIDKYFKFHQKSPIKSKNILNHPEFQKLLAPYFKTKNKIITNWLNEAFENNPQNPENLSHKTIAGIYVRSKSESFIVEALYTKQIPFKYECKLKIGSTIYYPDFTIMHPKTHKLYYWEHCGRADDPQYMTKTYSKFQVYTSQNIFPKDNLIFTFETQNHPFDLEQARKIVDEYFL